jgi:hypothetical protein
MEPGKNKGINKNHIPYELEKHQKAIANYLGRKFNQLPMIHKKLVLVTLSMAIGGFCFWSIIDRDRPARFSMDSITMPIDVRLDQQTPDPVPDSPEIQRIRLFKQLLDSLLNKGGKQKYDSIFFHNPGLRDSIDNLLNH